MVRKGVGRRSIGVKRMPGPRLNLQYRLKGLDFRTAPFVISTSRVLSGCLGRQCWVARGSFFPRGAICL